MPPVACLHRNTNYWFMRDICYLSLYMPVTLHSPLCCILVFCCAVTLVCACFGCFFLLPVYPTFCLYLRSCVLHFILAPLMHVTEMQHPQPDRAQASPAASKPSSADLLRVIPAMAAMISQQSLELTELKEALREIFHNLPRTKTLQGFLNILFLYSPQNPASDRDRIAILLFWLGAKALQWAAAVWEKQEEMSRSFNCLLH